MKLRKLPAVGKANMRSAAAWHWLYRRDVTAGADDFTRDDIPVEGTRMTVHGLRDGHVYELRIAAFTPGGVGPRSEPVEVTMPSARALRSSRSGQSG